MKISIQLPTGKQFDAEIEAGETPKEILAHLVSEGNLTGESSNYSLWDGSRQLDLGSSLQSNDVGSGVILTVKESHSQPGSNTKEASPPTTASPPQPAPTGMTRVKSFSQLGILVLDGSGSMSSSTKGNITKAEEVNKAVKGLIGRLKTSRRSKNFSMAVVHFDTSANVHTTTTEVEAVDEHANYDPMVGHGGGTAVNLGLKEAYSLAEKFLNEGKDTGLSTSVAVVVMSDGMCHNPEVTIQESKKLKALPKVQVYATLFGGTDEDNEARQLMKTITSNERSNYTETTDAETLRAFFERSMTTRARG